MTDLSRLSLNTATTKKWTLTEAVDGAARAGLPAVGLWRDRVHEIGLDNAVKVVRDTGLRVSSLCRGGSLTAADAAGIQAALDDNHAALDEAAALGTDALVMVVGGLPEGDVDLAGARQRVADRLAELVPRARARGVRLVLEPLHPMYVADRAVMSTVEQALDLASPYSPDDVAVVIDTFHVFWDPALPRGIERAGAEGRLASYQICDFNVPIAVDALLSRGMMGDGVIDLPSITRLVANAGYTGDVEVEIFNAEIWNTPGESVLATVIDRYRTFVLPHLQ